MSATPLGAGKNSFDLVNSKTLFAAIGLAAGGTLLDVACGFGSYSLAISERMGGSGKIFAFDLWDEGIRVLKEQIAERGIANIDARVVDVSQRLPLADASVDTVLMAMVLHDLIRDHGDGGALNEIRRVLAPHGKLAVVEFKKKEGPPGPPARIRLSPAELQNHLRPYGFGLRQSLDLGDHSYLSVFVQE